MTVSSKVLDAVTFHGGAAGSGFMGCLSTVFLFSAQGCGMNKTGEVQPKHWYE
jgi:hypothetical protein